MKCFENKDGHCVFDDDIVNGCIDKMVEADGIILGLRLFFLDVTAEMKGLIERAGFVSMANGGLSRLRVGMAVAAVQRYRGQLVRLTPMLHFLHSPGVWLSRDSLSSGLGGRSGT